MFVLLRIAARGAIAINLVYALLRSTSGDDQGGEAALVSILWILLLFPLITLLELDHKRRASGHRRFVR